MEKVEKKTISSVNDLRQFAKDEAVERVKAKVEAIPTEKVKELLPKVSFVEGMIDGIELYVILARP